MYGRTHEIAVDDACGVDILQVTEELVEKVQDELLLERARGKNTVEIGAQKLGDKKRGGGAGAGGWPGEAGRAP